ncbi:MAG: HlyD family efflux transporter periplasmic adaptor subunit [Hyphomicrobiales bacterium]
MKRIIPLLLIAAALAAFFWKDRLLPQSPGQNAWLGAVDARLTLVGPLAAGRLTQVAVHKGDAVTAGDTLFTTDDSAASASVTQAEAAVATAEATLRDLQSGKRAEELAVFDKQMVEAQANLLLARQNYLRANDLNNRGITAQAAFDAAKAAVDAAAARIEEITANRKAAELPARRDAIAAAQSRVSEAQAALAQARARLSDYSVASPATATVNDVFFAAGEVAAAGQPVVALHTPDALVLRFYVPEASRARLQPGMAIRFTCDSCAGPFTARVSHVFAQPEFTPPVIYSESARGKLVYQVEARIDGNHADLQPGLPVQVEPLP